MYLRYEPSNIRIRTTCNTASTRGQKTQSLLRPQVALLVRDRLQDGMRVLFAGLMRLAPEPSVSQVRPRNHTIAYVMNFVVYFSVLRT